MYCGIENFGKLLAICIIMIKYSYFHSHISSNWLNYRDTFEHLGSNNLYSDVSSELPLLYVHCRLGDYM